MANNNNNTIISVDLIDSGESYLLMSAVPATKTSSQHSILLKKSSEGEKDDDFDELFGIGWDDTDSKEESDNKMNNTNAKSKGLIGNIIDKSKVEVLQHSDESTSKVYNGYEVIYYEESEKIKNDENDIYANKNKTNIKLSTYGDKSEFARITTIINQSLYKNPINQYDSNEKYDNKGTIIIANTKTSEYEDSSVLTEYYNPLTSELLYREYEDFEKVLTVTYDSYKFIKSELMRYLKYCNISLRVELISDISEDLLKILRKETSVAINFPKIEYFKKHLNLDYVDKCDYRIMYTTEELKWIYEEIEKLPMDTVIAVDTETTGLKFHRWLKDDPRADKMVTIQISWKDNQAVIIPVRMRNRENASMDDINKYIKPILANRRILCQNGVADTLFCMYDELDINLCEDTMILAKHLMPYLSQDESGSGKKSRSSLNRSLKTLLDRAFHEDKIDLKKFVFTPLGLEFDFSILPDEYLIAYGCPDTDRLRILWKRLRPKLDVSQEQAYYDMVKFSQVMGKMATWAGVRLDMSIVKYGRDKQLELQKTIGNLALACVGETPETLKLSSPSKIANFIYTKLGVPITKKTKRTKMGFAADKEVISQLASEKLDTPREWFKEDIYTDETKTEVYISKDKLNNAKYPFCVLLEKWRDLNKDITGYYNSLLDSSIDGLYYIEYKVGGTDTWRTTAGIQTTKGKIKYAIKPFSDDWGVLCMDFSSEELRIASNIGKDPKMYEVLNSPEADAHRAVAASIFNIKPYQVTYDQRKKGKTTNFRILYGGGARGLAEAMYGKEPTVAQVHEAEDIHTKYYKTYDKMMTRLSEYRNQAQNYGWIQNDLGFRMIYDNFLDLDAYESEIFDNDDQKPPEIILDTHRYHKYRGSVATKSGNFPIQSYAGGMLMKLMNKFYDKIIERGYEGRIYVPVIVHDEINVFYHKSISPFEVFEMVKSTFEIKYDEELMVPLYIGMGFGNSWGEAKSDDAELPVRLQDIILNEFLTGTYDKSITCKEAPEYFHKRKIDYIKFRLRDLLADVLEYKVYDTGKVEKLLRDDIFVLAQGADAFHFFNKKTSEYDHKKILSVLIEDTDLKSEDITILKNDIIEDEDEADEYITKPFRSELNPRVTVGNSIILINVDNLNKKVLENLLKYLLSYSTKSDDVKQLRLELNGKISDPIKGINLKGLPITFNIDFNEILSGKSIVKSDNKYIDKSKLLKISDNHIIFNIGLIDDKNLTNKALATITKYSNKKEGRKIYISSKDKTVDIGLHYNESIPIMKLQEEISAL